MGAGKFMLLRKGVWSQINCGLAKCSEIGGLWAAIRTAKVLLQIEDSFAQEKKGEKITESPKTKLLIK